MKNAIFAAIILIFTQNGFAQNWQFLTKIGDRDFFINPESIKGSRTDKFLDVKVNEVQGKNSPVSYYSKFKINCETKESTLISSKVYTKLDLEGPGTPSNSKNINVPIKSEPNNIRARYVEVACGEQSVINQKTSTTEPSKLINNPIPRLDFEGRAITTSCDSGSTDGTRMWLRKGSDLFVVLLSIDQTKFRPTEQISIAKVENVEIKQNRIFFQYENGKEEWELYNIPNSNHKTLQLINATHNGKSNINNGLIISRNQFTPMNYICPSNSPMEQRIITFLKPREQKIYSEQEKNVIVGQCVAVFDYGKRVYQALGNTESIKDLENWKSSFLAIKRESPDKTFMNSYNNTISNADFLNSKTGASGMIGWVRIEHEKCVQLYTALTRQ